MGRAKQYERTELLNKAVELFRNSGFNGTSTADLVDELGINRKSMYAEFGSKQELFESTLQHYFDNHLSRVLAPIEHPDASTASIRRAFSDYASASEGWFHGKGCLMCNTAVERGALDPGSAVYVAAYFDRITNAFRHALANALESGEIGPGVDLDRIAAFLTTALVGVAASIRAQAEPELLHATASVVSDLLDALAHGRLEDRAGSNVSSRRIE